VVYRIAGKVAHTSVEHAVSLSEQKYCSVSAMLEKVAKIESVIEYVE
jgi:putative redox protein